MTKNEQIAAFQAKNRQIAEDEKNGQIGKFSKNLDKSKKNIFLAKKNHRLEEKWTNRKAVGKNWTNRPKIEKKWTNRKIQNKYEQIAENL